MENRLLAPEVRPERIPRELWKSGLGMLNVDGLISGLDTSSLIEQILLLERRPIDVVARQVLTSQQRRTAFLDLSARLLNVQVMSRRLADPEIFDGVTANSSSPEALVASAEAGVPPGVYSFQVARLAGASQYISGGFASADADAVGAGTLSLELGGFVDVETELDELNGGTGVTRGSLRITDSSGASAVVDLSAAITVRDVIAAIDDAGVDVTARVAGASHAHTGRGLVLTDDAGGAGALTVEEVGGLDTAADLGLLGSSVTGTLEGGRIMAITEETLLAVLGDGLGVRTDAGDDLSITDGNGVTAGIDLDAGVRTVGDLIQAFADAATDVSIAVNASGDGFTVTDDSGGGGDLIIADGGASTAATDLGIVESGTMSGSVAGSTVFAGIDDVLLDTLNGGAGFVGGSIDIQDRASGSPVTVDLSSARTLQDVLRAIDDSAAQVTATVDDTGNGILVRDVSGGTGTLGITESGGTVAAQLGILASVDADEIDGTDLDPRYVHGNTLLASLNGGRGVAAGSVRVTDSSGIVFTVDLSQETTMGDVVRDLNGAASLAGSDLVATFNTEGNGLLLTSASGSGTLRVDEVSGGTTARDLGIAGPADAATPGVIDGTFEETITIAASDTLEDVRAALDDLGIDVNASIVNDGSATAPFRLNIVSATSGTEARLLVETGGGTGLSFGRTARARDGAIFYGETGAGSESILIRSGSNTYRDIVSGLTVTAFEAGGGPVSITVESDLDSIRESATDLVERVNGLLAEIRTLTEFDLETEQRGVLLGDGTVRNLERSVLRAISAPLGADNTFTLMSQIGIRVRGDRVELDPAALDAALAQDPDAVRTLLSARRPLEETVELADLNDGNGIDTDTTGAELRIHLRDGTTVDVDLDGAVFVRDVIEAINTAGAASGLTASIAANQRSLVLVDATTGAETFRVTALNGSPAFNELGINKSADVTGGDTLTGREIDLAGDIGVMARLTDAIEELVKPDGTLQRRADGFGERIAGLEERIDQLEERLANRAELLRRQFAQLEEVIAASQSTLARLNAQLGGLGLGG